MKEKHRANFSTLETSWKIHSISGKILKTIFELGSFTGNSCLICYIILLRLLNINLNE